MSSNPAGYRSASSRSGPCFKRPIAITARRMDQGTTHAARFALTHCPKERPPRLAARARTREETSDRLRGRRALSPQSLEIVELAHLGSEDMHDHIAGIDQHPVAIGQALDMDVPDAVFLQAFGDIFRDRADVPVGPARSDDHVVGKCGLAAKVD